jgi:hypothetical protein
MRSCRASCFVLFCGSLLLWSLTARANTPNIYCNEPPPNNVVFMDIGGEGMTSCVAACIMGCDVCYGVESGVVLQCEAPYMVQCACNTGE